MNINDVTIRPYEDTDKNSIVEMYEEFSKFLESIDTFSIYKKHVDHLKVAKYHFAKMTRKVKKYDGAVFVVSYNESLIGFTGMHIEEQAYEDTLDTIPMKTGTLGILFVKEKYRGQGLGSALIKRAEEYFKEKNCTHSSLDVWSPNVNAYETYKKANYSNYMINMIKTL